MPSKELKNQGKPKAVAEGAATISPMIIVPPIIIAAVMSGLLGLVYGVTKEPIAESKRLEKQNKLAEVMPAFDNDPLSTQNPLSDTVTIYTGEQGDTVSGYGIESAVNTGYSGHFSVVFGVSGDGTINKVQILESSETPGLGSKAGEPFFIDQFNGKKLDDFTFKVTKDGGDVDAITGATITSRAVCACLQGGLDALAGMEPAGATESPAAEPSATAETPEVEGEGSAEQADSQAPAVEAGGSEGEAVEAPAEGEPAEPGQEEAGQAEPEPKPAEEPAGER